VVQVDDDRAFFQLAARQYGLQVHHSQGGRDVLSKLGLPAVIACNLPGNPLPRYLSLQALADGRITLSAGEDRGRLATRPETLNLFWSGTAYILWKNFYAYPGVIPLKSPPEAILTLKMHLKALGFEPLAITPHFDAQTREAVQAVQARHGIDVDGYVGTLTKIVLYNDSKELKIPRLFP
jgi:general secretion pathway protein A